MLAKGNLNFTRYYKSPAFLEAKETLADNHMIQKMCCKLWGTALILAIVEQVRDRDEQTRAAALSEARALQARIKTGSIPRQGLGGSSLRSMRLDNG
jgi:hypothetical protein